jgi:tetratricopeptide (TPR) repeat protein
LLADRAWVYLMNKQEIDLAIRLAQEALELFRTAGDRLGQARTDNVLGYAYWLMGRYQESRDCFKDALARLESPGDNTEIANILSTFGIVVAGQPGGDPVEARQYLEEATSLRRKLGDRRGLGEALTNLGILAYREADWPQAWAHYAEALEHEQALGNTFGIARTLYNLAEVAEAYLDFDHALRLAAAAERLMEIVKSPLVGLAADLFSKVAEDAGDPAIVDGLRQECAIQPTERLVEWALG